MMENLSDAAGFIFVMNFLKARGGKYDDALDLVRSLVPSELKYTTGKKLVEGGSFDEIIMLLTACDAFAPPLSWNVSLLRIVNMLERYWLAESNVIKEEIYQNVSKLVLDFVGTCANRKYREIALSLLLCDSIEEVEKLLAEKLTPLQDLIVEIIFAIDSLLTSKAAPEGKGIESDELVLEVVTRETNCAKSVATNSVEVPNPKMAPADNGGREDQLSLQLGIGEKYRGKSLLPVAKELPSAEVSTASASKPRPKRRSVKNHAFTDGEVNALIAGVRQHGKKKWAQILESNDVFKEFGRNSKDLLDKWRNLVNQAGKRLHKNDTELGWFNAVRDLEARG